MQPNMKRMRFKRSDLREDWATLYELLDEAAVIDYKQRLTTVLTDSM